MALIKFNGVPVLLPSRGLEINIVPVVDTLTNANGELVSQKVGRDRYELNGLLWPYLEADVWQGILEQVKKPLVDVTFSDPQTGSPVTIKMICRGKYAKAFRINNDGEITHYINCSIELEDTGA